jgi:methane/ammonia monooxygenase subunit A
MSSTVDYQETRAATDVPLPAKVAAARASRAFDLVIAVIAFFTIAGTFHLHYMLLAGDWDFWVDWKDRQFWPTLSPVVAIMFCAATQAYLWEKFRLPIGATLCILALLFGEWVDRVLGFHMWAGLPYSLIWPATLLPGALFLDTVLLLSRSFLVTAIIGAWGFGLLFYPGNWPMLAQYHSPIEHMGQLESTADMVGYTFVRSSTPEYLRFIERGTLRTFGGHSAWISAFFSAFLCMMTYLLWWYIGLFFAKTTWLKSPIAKYLGVKPVAKASD